MGAAITKQFQPVSLPGCRARYRDSRIPIALDKQPLAAASAERAGYFRRWRGSCTDSRGEAMQ